MQLVYLEWIDSSSTRGWWDAEKDETALVYSVGWLVNKTKRTITISTSRSETNKFADQMNIPLAAIRKYRVIKEYPNL